MAHPEEVVDGKHMEVLKYALSVAVKKIGIGSDSMYERFKYHFHPIYKKNPEDFRSMYLELACQVESNFNAEVKQIFDDENIPTLMNELDKMIEKCAAEIESQAWRPSGDASKDSVAHAMPIKLRHKQRLEKLVTELESINKIYQDAHKKKQRKLIKTKQSVDKLCDKWTEVISEIKESDMQTIDECLENHLLDI